MIECSGRQRIACRSLMRALLALAAVLSIGCSSHRSTDLRKGEFDVVAAAPVERVPLDDTVGAGDLLDVMVLGHPDLTRTVRVATDGDVSLPLIGALPAAGRSVVELERDIALKYGQRYLRDPHVSVFLKEAAGRSLTVSGAVRNPGMYPIEPGTTLMQAVALAEGLDPLADDRSIVVFRPSPEGRTAAVFDLRAIQRGDSADPALRFGDIVVVEQSGSKTALRRFIETVPALGLFGLFL